jgi:hypothetical protein
MDYKLIVSRVLSSTMMTPYLISINYNQTYLERIKQMSVTMKARVLEGLAPTKHMQETIINSIHMNTELYFGYEANDEGVKKLNSNQIKSIAEIVKDNSMDFYSYQNANFAFRYILNVKHS